MCMIDFPQGTSEDCLVGLSYKMTLWLNVVNITTKIKIIVQNVNNKKLPDHMLTEMGQRKIAIISLYLFDLALVEISYHWKAHSAH